MHKYNTCSIKGVHILLVTFLQEANLIIFHDTSFFLTSCCPLVVQTGISSPSLTCSIYINKSKIHLRPHLLNEPFLDHSNIKASLLHLHLL